MFYFISKTSEKFVFVGCAIIIVIVDYQFHGSRKVQINKAVIFIGKYNFFAECIINDFAVHLTTGLTKVQMKFKFK